MREPAIRCAQPLPESVSWPPDQIFGAESIRYDLFCQAVLSVRATAGIPFAVGIIGPKELTTRLFASRSPASKAPGVDDGPEPDDEQDAKGND